MPTAAAALDEGITSFDTADGYAPDVSAAIIGATRPEQVRAAAHLAAPRTTGCTVSRIH